MRSDYTYELRDRAGTILSTGRLTLAERPAPGSTIQLGKHAPSSSKCNPTPTRHTSSSSRSRRPHLTQPRK